MTRPDTSHARQAAAPQATSPYLARLVARVQAGPVLAGHAPHAVILLERLAAAVHDQRVTGLHRHALRLRDLLDRVREEFH